MFIFSKSHEYRRSARKAFTLIELLALIFVIASVAAVHQVFRGETGEGMALVASALALLVSVSLVVLFYRWSWKRDRQRLARLRQEYRTIYQVREVPDDAKCTRPAGAEIRIGDYGWDTRPNRRDGLIHLQGLTMRWQVVWHAAFRADQIEKVTTKSASQYDYWTPYWAKSSPPPPCPFPVRERSTPTMGLPHHSGHYFTDYPSQYYQSPGDAPERNAA